MNCIEEFTRNLLSKFGKALNFFGNIVIELLKWIENKPLSIVAVGAFVVGAVFAIKLYIKNK